MNTQPIPLKTYEKLKAEMDKAGISPIHHTPYILEFLLQRERAFEARLILLEKKLAASSDKVLSE